jgi:phosphoglycolate phosphatase
MNARRFELLVFDWDGTLMDSTALIAACIQAAARDLGLPVPDHATASHVIGLGLKDALSYAVPQLAEADYARMSERYGHHFRASDTTVPLFDGTNEMLSDLSDRGHLLGVATGKSTKGLERAMAATGIARHFAAVRCADRCTPKPAPDMLHELMDEFAVRPESTLMIGDTTHDLEMAANAGVAAVAVSYGAHPRNSLLRLNPLACVASTAELAAWLKQNA